MASNGNAATLFGRDVRSTPSHDSKAALGDSTRSRALYAPSSESTGGVGLVFCRDPGSPYLLVKEVVLDGPAFQSSLIYPGDKLCCINDFDLAWSGNVPRNQQPQLPGPHGSNVVLTFDRSLDATFPERFAITLTRNKSFFPDKLTGSLFGARGVETSPSKASKSLESASQETLAPKKPTIAAPQKPIVESRNFQPSIPQQQVKIIENGSIMRGATASADTNPSLGYQNGWKPDSKTISAEYRIPAIPEVKEMERTHFPEERNQLVQDFHQENKLLQDTVQNLRKDLTDCHVQITFLQKQLKIKTEEAANKAGEAAFAEKNILILKQRELEINDLQAKLSKEKVQREAAERRANLEKEETQKQLSIQQDMRVRIENFQEMLVKEALDRQKIQKKLNDLEQEVPAFEAVKRDYQLLQEQNEELMKELQDAKQSKESSAAELKALQDEVKVLQIRNEEVTLDLANTKQLLSKSGRVVQPTMDNSAKQPDQSVYDVFISTGAPQRERERAIRPPESEQAEVQKWGIPNLQSNNTPVKTPGKPLVESYAEDVELHQSPGAMRNESWRQGGSDLFQNRGPNISLASSPLSPTSRRMGSPNSPSPIYVSPHRLDDSPSTLYQKQQFSSMLPADFAPVAPIPTESPAQNRRGYDQQNGQRSMNALFNANLNKNGPNRRAGIGMSFHLDPATRYYVIKEVHPLGSAGQAAANGDLLVGDILLAVNGVFCDGKQISEIIDLIVGPEGSEVQLTLRRRVSGQDFQITLTLLRNRPLAPATGTDQRSDQRSATISMMTPQHAMEQRPATIAVSPTQLRSPPIPPAPLQNNRSPTTSNLRIQPPRNSEWERSRTQDGFPAKPIPSNRVDAVNPMTERDLPPGWIQELDPSSGRIYFVNHNLKTFCWNRPG